MIVHTGPIQVAALVLGAAAVLGAAPTAAQGVPDREPPEVAWEFVGPDSASVFALALLDPADGRPHGLPGAPLASLIFPNTDEFDGYETNIYRLVDPDGGPTPPEPDPAWVPVYTDGYVPNTLYAEASGLALVGDGVGPRPFDRSTDGGATWERVATDDCRGNGADPRIVRTYGPGREGALWVLGHLCRSDDDGATWAPLDEEAPTYLRRRDLLELPPSDALPEGRLLLGVGNGLLRSDDSGATWQATSLYEAYRWVGEDLELAPDEAHPYGGTVYLAANDFFYEGDAYAVVLASDDGGESWDERARFPNGSFGLPYVSGVFEIEVLGDGALVAGLTGASFGVFPIRRSGAVAWSGDGGRTWSDLGGRAPWIGEMPPAGACGPPGPGPACEGGVWPGWSALYVRVDREGRVWVGTDNGVWRTTGPAWAVASEGPRGPGPVGLDVSVRPNPAAGRVEVAVRGAASRPVRVVILDALGREVAVVWDGPVRAGQRLEASTAGLTPGTYAVRATTGGESASVVLTLAR